MEKLDGQSERIGELEKSLEDIVEERSNGPVVAPAEERRTTTEATEEAASEAAKPVQAAETPIDPAKSPASEVRQ